MQPSRTSREVLLRFTRKLLLKGGRHKLSDKLARPVSPKAAVKYGSMVESQCTNGLKVFDSEFM